MRDEILDLKNAKSIAVMGGTFDPIHYGHLVAAEAVRSEYDIEKVIFIPTGNPVHKTGYNVTHTEHRYLMTVLATINNPYFSVSRMEIDRAGITYTIDTIRALREICGDDTKIYFITGADAVQQILTWKEAETLLTLCSFVGVTRPGYNEDKLKEQVTKVKTKYKSRIHFLEVPALAISSSEIRQRIGSGKPIKYLLPEEVEKYIYKMALYKEATVQMPLQEMKARLKASLTEARYAHSLGVMEESVKLGKYYKQSDKVIEKLQVAGLLHDCAKCLPEPEMKKICKENGIKLDDILKKRINLAHSFAGAVVAKRDYLVTDKEILSAIDCHTFGKRDMSFVDKAVCLADYIEPNREEFSHMAELRKLAYEDMDKALLKVLEQSIDYNIAKKREIYVLSYEAVDSLRAEIKNKTEVI